MPEQVCMCVYMCVRVYVCACVCPYACLFVRVWVLRRMLQHVPCSYVQHVPCSYVHHVICSYARHKYPSIPRADVNNYIYFPRMYIYFLRNISIKG